MDRFMKITLSAGIIGSGLKAIGEIVTSTVDAVLGLISADSDSDREGSTRSEPEISERSEKPRRAEGGPVAPGAFRFVPDSIGLAFSRKNSGSSVEDSIIHPAMPKDEISDHDC